MRVTEIDMKAVAGPNPVTLDDASQPYKSERSYPRTITYIGLKNRRELHRYVLSPAFLPALIVQAKLDTDILHIKDIMPHLREYWKDPDDAETRLDFPDTIAEGLARHSIAEAQKPSKARDKEGKTRQKLYAFLVWWIVEMGPKELDQPKPQLKVVLDEQYDELEAYFPKPPVIDLNQDVARPTWTHEGDPDEAERYNRTYQLLKLIWHNTKNPPNLTRTTGQKKTETHQETWVL